MSSLSAGVCGTLARALFLAGTAPKKQIDPADAARGIE
jgi:hypothetical protein